MARVSDAMTEGGAAHSTAPHAAYDAFISYSQRGDKATAEALRTDTPLDLTDPVEQTDAARILDASAAKLKGMFEAEAKKYA